MLSSFNDSPLKEGDEVFVWEYEEFGRVVGMLPGNIHYVVEVTALHETVAGVSHSFMKISQEHRKNFFSKVGSA